MELTIDNRPCDLIAACAVPGYHADKSADIEACREGRSLRLSLPRSHQNDALMGFASDPHGGTRFNDTRHHATLSCEGATLLCGRVRLLGCSAEDYTIEIRDGGAQWATNAALRMFNTLGVQYDAQLTAQTIAESWTNNSPVKFFPIHREEYPQHNSSTDLLPAERQLTVDDYHPFLHIATLLQQLFAEAGYTIESRFLNTPFFRSLYLSGAYSAHDTTAIAARMGFFARRLAPVTATADYSGCVYANPFAPFSSLGNLVDTATPQTFDTDGEPIPELANNGGCFSIDNRRIVFTPPTTVSVGFEYYLRYTTTHRILSRTRLRGFDGVYLGADTQLHFTLTNRYKDRRTEITPNYSYRALVFDHTAGAQYRLTFTQNGVSGTTWAEFATRSTLVTTPLAGSLSTPSLSIRSGTSWLPYTGDWALYDGYITEMGQTTVELRLHTAAEALSAATPRRFDQIYLFGAEEGMSLTLHKECSLRPRFLSVPGFGSRIGFQAVAQHRIRQIELLEALAHLFNLRFYTEQEAQRVWIEPVDDLYHIHREIDWRSKSDFSQPVVREELALEVHKQRTWAYREGEGDVKRLEEEGNPFGSWSTTTPGYASLQGEALRRNPLFCPTISSQGHYRNAPSAYLLQVGDRDRAAEPDTPFTPRIVRYVGLQPLPANERWGYPSNEAFYPLAAFHYPAAGEAGFSLCFEDRDGQVGLHRYYDRQVAQEAIRERITLNLRLAPHEFEALLTPGTGAPDIHSRFRLDTGAGEVLATLHNIDNYNPEANSTRCTFIRTPED